MARADEWSIQPFEEILDDHEADYRQASGAAAKESKAKDIAKEIQADAKRRSIGVAFGEMLMQVSSSSSFIILRPGWSSF